MSAAPVRAVKPQLTQREARVELTRKRWFSFRKPEFRRMELVYLPYYFFQLFISRPAGEMSVSAAVDGLTGTFALVEEPSLQYTEPDGLETPGFRISSPEAEKICRNEYRHRLFSYALRQKASVTLKTVELVGAIHYPYWIAYFKIGAKYDFSALDAVSGKPTGIKMRQIFVTAFSGTT